MDPRITNRFLVFVALFQLRKSGNIGKNLHRLVGTPIAIDRPSTNTFLARLACSLYNVSRQIETRPAF